MSKEDIIVILLFVHNAVLLTQCSKDRRVVFLFVSQSYSSTEKSKK